MRAMRVASCLAVLFALLSGSSAARAEEGAPSPVQAAAQLEAKAKASPQHQVTVLLGLMPTGDFVNHLTATLAYERVLSRHFAWEVVHGTFAHGYQTKLARELGRIMVAIESIMPTQFTEIRGVVGSNLHLRARYDGTTLAGSNLLSFEARLYAGPLAVLRQHAHVGGTVSPGFDAGIQVRSGLGELFTLTLDGGLLTHFPKQRWKARLHELYARAGVGVQF